MLVNVTIYARTSTFDGGYELTNQTENFTPMPSEWAGTIVAEFHNRISRRNLTALSCGMLSNLERSASTTCFCFDGLTA